MAILVITEIIYQSRNPLNFWKHLLFLMTHTLQMHLALSSRGVITKYSKALNLYCGVVKISQNWLGWPDQFSCKENFDKGVTSFC